MAEGHDESAIAFSSEIQPQVQPRDSAGKFIATTDKPEPIFGERPIEGDDAGDTRDGGDDDRLRARERDVADGRVDERQGPRRASDTKDVQRAAPDDGHDGEPESIWDVLAEDEGADREVTAEPADAEKFEVTVDGETRHVTLGEMQRGYIRQETFHKRMSQVNQAQGQLEAYDAQLRSNWAWWDKARRDYEEDLANLVPVEPNWDQEFARDPAGAHATQKIFQTIYAKLQQSQALRAQREAAEAAETDRRVQKYAVDGFSKFVMDNKIPDEATLKKNLQSMRRTAANAGFSEYEVATVYDPRMLSVLLKASKYDRMMAARPRAVIPGKGRTLTPGAATPLGNAPRKGLDEALRRQASSGRLDDTADVFRRLL